MKQTDVLLSWLISLVLGSLICGLVMGEPLIAFIFCIVAAICSVPYLVLMLVLVRRLNSFFSQQLLHFILALLTAAVLMIFEREFFRNFYIIFPYYFSGVITHYWFFRYRKDTIQSNDQELLDNLD